MDINKLLKIRLETKNCMECGKSFADNAWVIDMKTGNARCASCETDRLFKWRID